MYIPNSPSLNLEEKRGLPDGQNPHLKRFIRSDHCFLSFPYDPLLVAKVKTIHGRRWHPEEKHCSFPKLEGMLEKILKVFEDEDIHLDPALKTAAPNIKDTPSPPEGEGRGEGYHF